MRNFVSSFFLLIFLSCLSVFTVANAADESGNSIAVHQPMPADAQKKDAETIKILLVVNDNEVDVNNMALKKTSNHNVKKLAKHMKNAHVDNIKQLKKLFLSLKLEPRASDASIALETDGKNLFNKLDALQGKAFDTAYIEAIVNGHKKVLQLIDVKLIPNTTNPQLLKQLKNTRAMVAAHLQKAEAVQKQLST